MLYTARDGHEITLTNTFFHPGKLIQCTSIGAVHKYNDSIVQNYLYYFNRLIVTKQLLGNVFKTFQNYWILGTFHLLSEGGMGRNCQNLEFFEMLSFLLVVFRFFLRAIPFEILRGGTDWKKSRTPPPTYFIIFCLQSAPT